MEHKHIFQLCEHLRGELQPEEYLDVIFPVLTIKHISETKSPYYIPEDATWNCLIASGLNLVKRVEKAIELIEGNNYRLNNVLNIFPGKSLSDVNLYNFMLGIDEIQDHKQFLKTVIDHFSKRIGKASGVWHTSNTLNELIVRLIAPMDGSFYDGTAGLCNTLIEASEFAEQEGGALQLYGQEIDPKIWALGKINLIFNECHDVVLEREDSLRNPMTTEDNNLKTFDYIGMNIPFGLRDWGVEEARRDLFGRFRYGIPSKQHGDMAFILHALTSLNRSGKAAIVVPHGVLFRGGREAKIREKLINNDVIEGVVDLPSGLLAGTNIPVSIIILNKLKPEESTEKIFMVNAKDIEHKGFELPREDLDMIIEAYIRKDTIDGFSMWINREDIIDHSLLVKNYFEDCEVTTPIGKFEIDRKDYENNTETVSLKSLGTFYRGLNTHAYKTQKSESPTHKILQLSNVENGEIFLENADSYNAKELKNPSSYEVQPGDVIISSRGNSIKIAVIPEEIENTLLSHNFIGFRPNDNVDPYFIKYFMESPIGIKYLSLYQKGSAVSVLKVKDIEKIYIPKVSLEEQKAISNKLRNADLTLQRKIQKAKEEHKQLYLYAYRSLGIHESITEKK
ncbi:N-6 DNA methylase [Natranaerobius thermophilus]|uniref:site-specific DNA-methyltransferase (adenine-specific) n=1 Tax=Natranaerobius thermophilus (strain ATCC BAA-1301 / DSM 18059 / JW/NM-WN-LF) TaxID=457570 RepID=B2A7S7_NATTJ|nr:N-6 DNA methylase [Natranaerobius thermophilus]ACB84379.1 N-6 DNA methylase [Natranaerobius thermophilus JW/NM-WN-LF]